MKLKLNTVNDLLYKVLLKLMQAPEFLPFRLVGGTSLSLQLGHRLSVDIDLFSDYSYSSIDFDAIDRFLKKEFNYVDSVDIQQVALGKSYYVGDTAQSCIKLDLYYTDSFIRPYIECDNIRLASLEDIAAMKLEVISNKGRKKDFWDIHELSNVMTLENMLSFHKERYPYSHDKVNLINSLTDFSMADNDFDPVCLKGNYWELIKLDIIDMV
ncbi:MAG: nucleotidyl transferase AbiEii/AbiGii toxin family protein [Rikenellaceae bacterium]